MKITNKLKKTKSLAQLHLPQLTTEAPSDKRQRRRGQSDDSDGVLHPSTPLSPRVEHSDCCLTQRPSLSGQSEQDEFCAIKTEMTTVTCDGPRRPRPSVSLETVDGCCDDPR